MFEFVGININTESVECWGHRMASGTFYFKNKNETKILDDLEDIPDEIKIFWYSR